MANHEVIVGGKTIQKLAPMRDLNFASRLPGGKYAVSLPPEVELSLSGPGSRTLITGTDQLGWYGEVSSDLLVDGLTLASLANLTAGTTNFSDSSWLKFAHLGKTLFVAKKPLRHSLSWDDLNAQSLITGNTTIKIGDYTYSVRLLRIIGPGKVAESSSFQPVSNPEFMVGSEWHQLMLPLMASTADMPAAYSSSDLSASQPCHAMELVTGGSLTGLSMATYGEPGNIIFNYTDDNTGMLAWRPVLELTE